jgi:hypothetical protein
LNVSFGSINGWAANADGGIQASDEREYRTSDDTEPEEHEGRGGDGKKRMVIQVQRQWRRK